MLTDNDLNFVAGPAVFTPLVNDTLGNAGGPDDGFDSLFNPVAAGYADDLAGLNVMDTHIAGADFNPGEFDASQAAPVALDIATASNDIDGSLSDLGGFASTPPPITGDPSQTPNVRASDITANDNGTLATGASFSNARIGPQ